MGKNPPVASYRNCCEFHTFYSVPLLYISTFPGKLKTTARWMRDFVEAHPAYKHDSVVNEEVNFDLIEACVKVTEGSLEVPELLPSYSTKSADDIPTAMQKAHKFYDNKA